MKKETLLHDLTKALLLSAELFVKSFFISTLGKFRDSCVIKGKSGLLQAVCQRQWGCRKICVLD